MRIAALLLVFVYLFVGCKAGKEHQEIKWYSFEEGLKVAKKEKKLILLDIYAKWCHWCNVMENTTYRNKAVIELINKYYIPVRVDADERPDINKRYNQGGLPSTVILTPDGEIVYGTIYVPPEDMVKMLQQFAKLSEEDIQLFVERNKMLRESYIRKFERITAEKEIKRSFIDFVYRILERRFDKENGGFKGAPKFPVEELPYFLMLYSIFNKPVKDFLEKTLYGYSKLIDRVEGGIFRYATKSDWSAPHYEKLLKDQAELSVMYFNAYSYIENPDFLKFASLLIRFMEERLYDNKSGYFYNSQGADIVDERGTLLMTGEEFFKLSKEERENVVKTLGYSPNIDRSVYFTTNALAGRAFLYSSVYNKNREHFIIGKRVIDNILRDGLTEEGIKYSKNINKYYLNTQVYTLEALLVLYQLISDYSYIEKIKELIDKLDRFYFSKKIGIYTDIEEVGLSLKRISFLDDIISLNARLARVLYAVALLENETDYKEKADKIISSLPTDFNLYTAVSYYLYHYSPLGTHIIGYKKDRDTFLRNSFMSFPFWNFSQFIDVKNKEKIQKLGYNPQKKTTAFICSIELCFKRETIPERIKEDIFEVFRNYAQMK